MVNPLKSSTFYLSRNKSCRGRKLNFLILIPFFMINLWFLLGTIFLGIGSIGIFVPLLPTTPLVLLAAACYAKSSPKAHQWLLDNRYFGSMVRNWETNRCVRVRVKWIAVPMIILVGGSSVWFSIPDGWPRIIAVALLAYGVWVVLHLQTCESTQ